MNLLEIITKHCEEIKQEFNIYRQTTQEEISDLRTNVEQLTKSVKEQRVVIEELKQETKTMKNELYENITNYIQQHRFITRFITDSWSRRFITRRNCRNGAEIAASANVCLNMQKITSIRRLKNGKTSITITDREKCNELITASFKKFIANPTKSPTSSKSHQHRVFISNALTPVNHRLYKKLRDLKTEGTIDRISFFNGTFSVHKPGQLYSTNIIH
jgi:hypothetical protein